MSKPLDMECARLYSVQFKKDPKEVDGRRHSEFAVAESFEQVGRMYIHAEWEVESINAIGSVGVIQGFGEDAPPPAGGE